MEGRQQGPCGVDLIRHAQSLPYGSREYADAVGAIIEEHLPIIKRMAAHFNRDCDPDDVG